MLELEKYFLYRKINIPMKAKITTSLNVVDIMLNITEKLPSLKIITAIAEIRINNQNIKKFLFIK